MERNSHSPMLRMRSICTDVMSMRLVCDSPTWVPRSHQAAAASTMATVVAVATTAMRVVRVEAQRARRSFPGSAAMAIRFCG